MLGEEARKAIIQMIEVIFGHIVEGLFYLLANDRGRRQLLLLITSITTLVFSVSILKELISIIFTYIICAISMPRLVREWGTSGFLQKSNKSDFSAIILRREEKERVHSICGKIKRGRQRKAPLQNILIHGKTGTGKSMIARAIAEESELPFAIMSGADIAPLDNLGPVELNNVLSWAQRQRNGGIVIIDEAESALGRRIRQKSKSLVTEMHKGTQNASSSSRDALNTFLSMTGDAYGKIMIILTTSNPSELDDAVLDRCDDILHCNLPQIPERVEILTNEFKKAFCPAEDNDNPQCSIKKQNHQYLHYDNSFNVEAELDALAKDDRTNGCSGRELTKLIRALQNDMFIRNETLSKELWKREINQICDMMNKKKKLNGLK